MACPRRSSLACPPPLRGFGHGHDAGRRRRAGSVEVGRDRHAHPARTAGAKPGEEASTTIGPPPAALAAAAAAIEPSTSTCARMARSRASRPATPVTRITPRTSPWYAERRRPRREGAARDNYRESRNYVSGGANGRANILTRGGDAREVSGEVLAGMELLLFHTGWMRVVRRRGVEWASRIR